MTQLAHLKALKSPVDLKAFEKEIWRGIFRKGGSKAYFHEALPSVAKMHGSIEQILITDFVATNIFQKDDRYIRARWLIHGYLMLLVSWYLLSGVSPMMGTITFWTMVPTIFCMAWQMPNRTSLGSKYVEACLGFKRFLEVTEVMRLQTTDHPKLSPEKFSRMLPYIVALGIEQDWQKAIPYLALSIRIPAHRKS